MNSNYIHRPEQPRVVVFGYGTAEITLPVKNRRRKNDTHITVSMDRQQLEAVRDAINAALLPQRGELIRDIVDQYHDDLIDDLNEKVKKRREELEAMTDDELRQTAKALKGE